MSRAIDTERDLKLLSIVYSSGSRVDDVMSVYRELKSFGLDDDKIFKTLELKFLKPNLSNQT